MVRKEERNRHDGIGNGTGKAGDDGGYLQIAGGKQIVLVYDMEHDAAPAIYSLTDTIKANIYDDLEIDFSGLEF